MKQFILNAGPDNNGLIRFEGGDYRYLARSRRLAAGEYFPAVLPDGAEALVQVCSVDNQTLVGKIVQDAGLRRERRDSPLPPVILFQSLPRGEKMDLIVRQAAEGALAEIVPFVSEFSVKTTAKTGTEKFARWQRIIKEARQQSGSAVATAIRQPVSTDELFAYWRDITGRQSGALGLFFHHLPLANKGLHQYLNKCPEVVVVVIGPEGGFSSAEAERFLSAGFNSFMIGDTILRTETAALYAQAAVRILLLEKKSWEMK